MIKTIAIQICILSLVQAEVLHDQLDQNGPPMGVSSYTSSTLADHVQAADDFVVPPDTIWHIAALQFRYAGSVCFFRGYQWPYPIDVTIYQNDQGLPGTMIDTLKGQTVVRYDDPVLSLNLERPFILHSGTYWISIQIDTDPDACSALIGTSRPQVGLPYAWQTGQAWACEIWGVGMDCQQGPFNPDPDPDLAFALYNQPFAAPVPTLDARFLAACCLILMCLGIGIQRGKLKKNRG